MLALFRVANIDGSYEPVHQSALARAFTGLIWASTRENLSLEVCKQHRRRPACASAQSDQRLCCSLLGKYYMQTCCRWNFNSLASLCSWGDWFETRSDGNPEDRFSCHEVIFLTVDDDEGSDKKGNVAASNNYTCMFEVWLRNCMIGIIISWAGHIYYAFKSVGVWLKQ